MIEDGKAYIQYIVDWLQEKGFSLSHKPECKGCGKLTRHSHYFRKRKDNLVIWRIQWTCCRLTFTVLPQFVLRYSKVSVDKATKALYLTHYGSSLEVSGQMSSCSPMSIYRLVCQLGENDLVKVNSLSHLSLPEHIQADEKHSHCLEEKVYLPTIESEGVIWHLGYAEDKSEESFTESYKGFSESAKSLDGNYQPESVVTDGFASTINAFKNLFSKVKVSNCLLHAVKNIRGKLKFVSETIRNKLESDFSQILFGREEKFLNIFCVGQQLRRFTEKVKKLAGVRVGDFVEQWIKKSLDGMLA